MQNWVKKLKCLLKNIVVNLFIKRADLFMFTNKFQKQKKNMYASIY